MHSTPVEKLTFVCRSYKRFYLELFKQSLFEVNSRLGDQNEAWLKMKNIIEDLLDHSCPVKTINNKKSKSMDE